MSMQKYRCPLGLRIPEASKVVARLNRHTAGRSSQSCIVGVIVIEQDEVGREFRRVHSDRTQSAYIGTQVVLRRRENPLEVGRAADEPKEHGGV